MTKQHAESNGHSEYSESNQTYEDTTPKSAFAEKLFAFPVIADSVTTINNYASNNSYVGLALQKAGTAVSTINKITNPVQARFQNQISRADELAAGTVDYVGKKFPIVQQPTEEIFVTVKQYQESFTTTIDSHVTAPAKNIATSVQGQLDQRVAAPAKSIAWKVDRSLTPAVNNFAGLVQKWLPEEDPSVSESERDIDADGELTQTVRALNLSVKAQRRLSRRVKAQFNSTQVYTAEQLKNLQESNALLQKATETVTLLNQRLLTLVASARQNAVSFRDIVQNPDLGVTLQQRLHDLVGAVIGDLDQNKDLPHAVQDRVIEISHALLATTDSISQYVKNNAPHFPDYLQVRLDPLVTFFNERYTVIVAEISKSETTPIQKAKNIVQLTSEQTLPILLRSLTDLQEAVQSYSSSLNSSLVNTTQTVKAHVENTVRALGVK